jgi:predicted ATPase
VRYLGRRVYLAAVVVFMSAIRYGVSTMHTQRLAQCLPLPRRTLERWRRWWLEQAHQEAHALLAPVYAWFTEGFGTKDLLEAKAILEALN